MRALRSILFTLPVPLLLSALTGATAGAQDQMAPLEGSLITEPNGIYTVNFAKAPAGEYKFYCLPHLALGMKAKLTVQ